MHKINKNFKKIFLKIKELKNKIKEKNENNFLEKIINIFKLENHVDENIKKIIDEELYSYNSVLLHINEIFTKNHSLSLLNKYNKIRIRLLFTPSRLLHLFGFVSKYIFNINVFKNIEEELLKKHNKIIKLKDKNKTTRAKIIEFNVWKNIIIFINWLEEIKNFSIDLFFRKINYLKNENSKLSEPNKKINNKIKKIYTYIKNLEYKSNFFYFIKTYFKHNNQGINYIIKKFNSMFDILKILKNVNFKKTIYLQEFNIYEVVEKNFSKEVKIIKKKIEKKDKIRKIKYYILNLGNQKIESKKCISFHKADFIVLFRKIQKREINILNKKNLLENKELIIFYCKKVNFNHFKNLEEKNYNTNLLLKSLQRLTITEWEIEKLKNKIFYEDFFIYNENKNDIIGFLNKKDSHFKKIIKKNIKEENENNKSKNINIDENIEHFWKVY